MSSDLIGSSRVVIKAAINGKAGFPGSQTPDAAAIDSVRAIEAGATMIHVHGRSVTGQESSDPSWYHRFMEVFVPACPDVLVSFTTKRAPDLLTDIQAWQPAPAVCSVNIGSSVDPWREVLDVLNMRGIWVEAGIANEQMADEVASLRSRFRQVILLAEGDDRTVAVTRYLRLKRRLFRGGWDGRLVAHAYGDATWGVVGTALACGDHVRVGFEDASCLPDGRLARSNGELVAAAVEMARAIGRTPVLPTELSRDF